MTTTDSQIQLAEQIARRLPKDSRNEWMRWMQVVERYGLERGLRYAENWAGDATLRPSVKRAYQLIARSVRTNLGALRNLERENLRTTLGYVSWHLRIAGSASAKERKRPEGRRR